MNCHYYNYNYCKQQWLLTDCMPLSTVLHAVENCSIHSASLRSCNNLCNNTFIGNLALWVYVQ